MTKIHECERPIGKLTADSPGYSLGGCDGRARCEVAGAPVVLSDLLGCGG